MQLGGNLRPSNLEELRSIRAQALDGNKTTPSAVDPKPVGEDQQGHEITVVDPSSALKHSAPLPEASSDHPVVVTQIATTPEQAVDDLAQGVEESIQLAQVLENILEIAPMMTCLRALNVYDLSPESVKIFEANHGSNLGKKKMILNNGESPVRIPVLMPGTADQWTSIVPPIIPAGIEVYTPDEHGKWITMKTPNRDPEPQEQQQVRNLIKKALGCYCGSLAAEEKLSEHEGAIDVNDVAIMIKGFDEENSLSTLHLESELLKQVTSQENLELLKEAPQQLSSPYISLLEGLGAAAEFLGRSAGVATMTVAETAEGALKGALHGGAVGTMVAIIPTIAAGSAATAALSASAASTVGRMGGAIGGSFASLFGGDPVREMGERSLIETPVVGGVLGSAVGVAGAAIAAHAGLPAVTAATGAMAGGVVGAIGRFPKAVEDSIKYFSPQQAWTKSMQAFSRWNVGEQLIPLIKQANEADEKVKANLEKFFKPFEKNSKCQKTKSVLFGQIDQRIAERATWIKRFADKKVEQNENAIPASGPIGTKRSAWVRL